MNILLLGSGGREHTLAWKLKQSPLCEKLYCAPGNAGTALCAINIDIAATDFITLKVFCLEHNISMVVVGPEEPLVKGIYDSFIGDSSVHHIAVIGPSQQGAMLEGSKAFAKAFMQRHNIPTAAYRTFNADTLEDAIEYVKTLTAPIVIKADGLAAGKGVVICSSKEEAVLTLDEFMKQGTLGDAGHTVVIEQFLKGIEFSVFVLTDGINYKILPIAKDYKRVGEGDTGPNTGGMGAVSPVPFVTDALMDKVLKTIVEPTVKGLQQERIVYKGFIYVGLIYDDTAGGPYVIEYNCRMGDPETEVVIPRLENDLVRLFTHVHEGTLKDVTIDISHKAAATVVYTSKGYPGAYEKHKLITGVEDVAETADVMVFYAGVKKEEDGLYTNGGRVLAVTALGLDLVLACEKAQQKIGEITFDGGYYRKDIGKDLIN